MGSFFFFAQTKITQIYRFVLNERRSTYFTSWPGIKLCAQSLNWDLTLVLSRLRNISAVSISAVRERNVQRSFLRCWKHSTRSDDNARQRETSAWRSESDEGETWRRDVSGREGGGLRKWRVTHKGFAYIDREYKVSREKRLERLLHMKRAVSYCRRVTGERLWEFRKGCSRDKRQQVTERPYADKTKWGQYICSKKNFLQKVQVIILEATVIVGAEFLQSEAGLSKSFCVWLWPQRPGLSPDTERVFHNLKHTSNTCQKGNMLYVCSSPKILSQSRRTSK